MPNWYSYCIIISDDNAENWDQTRRSMVDSFLDHELSCINDRLKVTKEKIVIRCTARKHEPMTWTFKLFQKYDKIHVEIGYSDVCNGLYGTWINNVVEEFRFITCDWMGVDTEDGLPDHAILSENYSRHLERYNITPDSDA